MAREPQAVAKEKSEIPSLLAAVEKVTYTPGPEGPMETEWMGHKFRAHVPRDLEIPDAAVMDALAKPEAERARSENERVGILSKKHRTNAELVMRARANKFFHVGEFDPDKHAYRDVVVEPKTAEAYRAWAVHWLKEMHTIDELCERWANEAKMRARLEVGYDDYYYMSHLFQPKVDTLIRMEDEPRKKRDEMIERGDLDGLILQIKGLAQAAM